METLPSEIIQHILRNSNLNFVDVVNFSSTCSKYRQIINSSKIIWKNKYFQRWPETDVSIICEDWYRECIFRLNFEKKVEKLLSAMSSKFFHFESEKIGSSQLNFIDSLISSHKYGYYYLRDFLIELNLLPVTHSLTHKYYGNILMKYIHRRYNKEVWNNLVQLNPQEQLLEKGAVFVTVWCQEYERGIEKKVTSELNETANKVKHYLFQHFMNHPLKNTSEEIQSTWKYKNIDGNFFPPKDCESIIWAINHVFFNDLKYYVTFDFNDSDKKRCGIDQALIDKKANPYIFAVIYESIARRLGVKIEVLDFPDDCFLSWKEDYSVNSQCHFIGANLNGIIKSLLCPRKSTNNGLVPPCNMQKLVQRLVLLMRSRELGESHHSLTDALKLQLVIKPFNLEYYQQMAETHMLNELDAKELIFKLKAIQNHTSNVESREFQSLLQSLEFYQEIWERNHNTNPNQTLHVQRRVEGIDFAVGMIVRDKFWELTGVIYGWDLETSQGNHQEVHYKILVEGGRYECIYQKNLQILHSPPFVSHPSLGRFFDKYCMTYFRPNKELQVQYPEDVEALQKILKKDRKT